MKRDTGIPITIIPITVSTSLKITYKSRVKFNSQRIGSSGDADQAAESEDAPRKWHISFSYGRDDEEADQVPEGADEAVEAVDAPTDPVEQD